MPILNNWIDSPLDFITDTIENSNEVNLSIVREYFEERVKSLPSIEKIPSLNELPPEKIKPNSLVRCRCMVQDQFDPEYFLGIYETIERLAGVKRIRVGLYRDSSDCGKDEEIIQDSSRNVTLERQSLYCVPIPAENKWVKDVNSPHKTSNIDYKESANYSKSNKRQRDEEMEEDNHETIELPSDVQKKQRSANGNTNMNTGAVAEGSQTNFDKNFPLPDEKGLPYLVIMYDDEDSLKLNEVVEFIGILSCDTSLATVTMDEPESRTDDVVGPGMMTAEEISVHCPPSSLVPRLHCILARKLNHSNPLIPSALNNEDYNGTINSFLQDSISIRENIIQAFEKLLYGDRIAAEYGRADVMALGKFSLNLTKCPSAAEPMATSLPVEIGKFFQHITTKSHYIPLTISNLNNQRFIPRKDYDKNRLVSGALQLSEGTHLVFDETVMEPGQLDTNGVQNVTAIGNVIQWQKVEYDFSFHKCDMKTDVTVLILSEARSLVQCDCMLPLKKLENSFEKADTIINSMDPCLLSKIRMFLDVVRLMNFNLSDEMQQTIKEDYVRMRESDSHSMNPEFFHLLLTMSRLIALSYGKDELTPDLWTKTKELEAERRQRCA